MNRKILIACGVIPLLIGGCTEKAEPVSDSRPLNTRPRVRVTKPVSHRFTDTAFVQGTVHVDDHTPIT